MRRRTVLSAVGTLSVGLSPGCFGGESGEPSPSASSTRTTETTSNERRRRYQNPVFERVFADPSVVRAPDGSFVAYATYNDWGGDRPRRSILVARSATLTDWTDAGEALAEKPDWKDADGLWAPDVTRLDGRYVLYYSLTEFGDSDPAIGVAVSATPTDTFTDRGPLLRSSEAGVPNSIDPYLLVDEGTPYLFWGSKAGIYGCRLTDDGLSLAGEPFQIAGAGVEAATLLRRRGRYYFLGSRGTCCEGAESTYHVVVGRATSLRGPYRNRTGESLLEATGTTILHGDDTFAGPGHTDVVADDAGTDWLVYHAYERADPWAGPAPRRVLMVDPLRWRDGWPRVPTASPSTKMAAPVVDN